MPEEILPELADNLQKVEDKKREENSSTKTAMYVFLPLIAIVVLCFKYHTLRIVVLGLSAFLMGYTCYKTYRARKNKFDKEIGSQIIVVFFAVLGIFFKFFGDLVLSYIALVIFCPLVMIVLKMEDSKQKLYLPYYALFGSIITALILNYEKIILLVKNI